MTEGKQVEQPADKTASTPEEPHQLTQEELDSMSYFEYLKFLNPDKSDAEIEAMVRKENRNVWMVRFELLALVLIVIAIIIIVAFT